MITLVLLLVACSSAESGDTIAPETTATTPTPSTTPEAEPARWDPDLAATLVELEHGTDGDWTLDNAVTAMELLLPVLRVGVDEYPPIDITALNFFLDAHADELTDDQRSRITAHRPAAIKPIGLGLAEDAETELAGFQLAAVSAASDFASRTGYTLPGAIVVTYSQYGLLPGGISAGARSFDDTIDWDRWSGFFVSDAEYLRAREIVEAAQADNDFVCMIVIGERFRNREPVPRSASIYHEVVHCHQHAIHPGGPRAFFGHRSPWMDEGYASWAGEAVNGGTALSKTFWDLYHDGVGPVGGHNTVEGEYDGIALFSYLHDNGIDGFSNFVSWFRDVRSSTGPENAKFNAIWTPLAEDAQILWAASSLQRPVWSDLWTYTTGPGIGNSTVTRSPRPVPVVADTEVSYTQAPGEQATFDFEPRLRDADALLLEFEVDDNGVIRWPWGVDQIVTKSTVVTWCLGDECVCDDGRELGPPAPEFSESRVITLAQTGAGVRVNLVQPEDKCEEEEAAVGATGPCPGGLWQADPEATADLLVTLYREFEIADPTYEGGPIQMSFFDDGTFRFDYLKTTFTETIDGFLARFVLNGGSYGTWEAAGGMLTVQIEGQDIQLDLYLDGVLSLTNTPPGGTGGGSVPYACDGNDVLNIDPTFEQPFWPYPRKWSRVTP